MQLKTFEVTYNLPGSVEFIKVVNAYSFLDALNTFLTDITLQNVTCNELNVRGIVQV